MLGKWWVPLCTVIINSPTSNTSQSNPVFDSPVPGEEQTIFGIY